MNTTTTRNPTVTESKTSRRLHDGWSVEAVGGPVEASVAGRSISASVPGSVHTDLLAAGLITDPYLDDHERLQAWIGACDWEYRTSFDWDDDGAENVELVFEGLDTVASITLNGSLVAETRNMHRTYRFDVLPLLHKGKNELTVRFDSAVRYADSESLRQGYRPHVNHHPYNSIRKMACSFGWDWGPDTATVGLWRGVTLQSWSRARLQSVRPTVTVNGTDGVATVRVEIERGETTAPAASALSAHITVGDMSAIVALEPGEIVAEARIVVNDAELWWPIGHGEHPLYDIDVVLTDGEAELDSWRGRIGFRTVRIDTEPDESGTPFTILVNDRPIYIKGANWIPDDAFPHRVDRARYERRIVQATHANINLLRVWGGGIYESDDFYDVCDELGMLTWQDFLFACAAYSEEEPMRSEVEAEARDNIVRLMPHPSLVIWNGSNENIWGYQEWGWEKRLGERSWGLGYYLDLLPNLLAELDPTRGYTPSSPFSPTDEHHPNDPNHGSVHLWELWNRQDYPHYRDHNPRFVGEFGWQGPPTWSTMTRSITDSPLTPESPGMLVHQKAQDGNVKLIDGLVAHLELPDDIDDWHWAMSLNQATAVQTGIEHFRSLAPHCMGSIVWQLNDCWPVTSWAAIDGDGRAKPLLYAIKHAYSDRMLTLQPRGDELIASASNDTGSSWSGTATVRRLRFDGTELATSAVECEVPARTTATIRIDLAAATPDDASSELLEVTLGGQRALWFFTEYRESKLQAPELNVRSSSVEGGYAVTVTAGNLVRDIALLVDKLDVRAHIDDQIVTLLPGESITFTVTSDAQIEHSDWSKSTVLRSANQLVVTA
ncbi:glycoside hydrolase family 2 protein [Subtercola boreus]|uniref:beta-mannosidase n=1 Tax=Subtercola boreus TaxID=120213 RepID=A0A3E0WFM7_9MICO|nr:glycoside hydrolase family 2 protein [Subtercola boreus]RFA23228.1 beta-mannosidase [Subtercola boreus]RFA23301.1 beta-mannosidase [Subtercola boreus]RFA29104.1 beta-mannosidase [Subtercola boreus]